MSNETQAAPAGIKTATLVEIMPTRIWIESDMLGARHVMAQHQGCEPFCYASFHYDYVYTSNGSTWSAASDLAISIGAKEPIEHKQRELEFSVPDLQGLRESLLNPGAVERDADGYWCNPAMPLCDEDVDCAKLLSAFGIDGRIVSAESQMDADAYEAMCETGGCIAWTPVPPDGGGWVMASIHGTEDGDVALYVRPVEPARYASQGDAK